jgi:integrase
LIEGLHFVRAAKPGKPVRWYVYAWRGGPRIMAATGPIKPKLDAAALEKLAAAREGDKQIQADMLGGMARKWRGNPADLSTASPEWQALAASTRETWGDALDLIEAKWGKTPLELWNDPRMVANVVAWRDDRAATPRAADIGVTVLSELLKWGKLRARVLINVAADVPAIYKGADRAEIIWTPADMDRAKAKAIELKRPRIFDAIELATLTGFRRADLIAVTLDEVSDHAIVRSAQKKSRGRRRRAVVPMIPKLADLVARLRALPRKPGVNTLLVNSMGRPWTGGSLTQAVNQVRDEAKIVQPADTAAGTPERKKHLHDCRGTYVTHLCRAGLTNEEIANIAAWSVDSVDRIRRTYVDDAAVVVALSERIRKAL